MRIYGEQALKNYSAGIEKKIEQVIDARLKKY